MHVNGQDYWCAICLETKNGSNPGYVSAINPDACYYSMGGNKDYLTSNKWMPIYSNQHLDKQPSDRTLAQGNQTGYGDIFSGIVETDDGPICGKAQGGSIWWTAPEEVKEKSTQNDHVVIKGWDVNGNWTAPTPQGSAGQDQLWAAICNTSNGWVPGYVFVDAPQTCYYAWHKEETSGEYVLIYSDVTSSDMEGKAQGFQTNNFGDIYSVLVETDFGLLPAKGMNGSAWWSWKGKSYHTTDTSIFKYVIGF